MTLIWTKSALPLSKLIRWTMNEPVSHFGIVFDNGIVFHSNLLGTHIEWYGSFVKNCDIVHSIEIPLSLEAEEAVYKNLLNTYDDKPYDFGALFYFGYRALLKKFFGVPLPQRNEWAKADNFLCTEIAGVLPESVMPKLPRDLAITSPYTLYLRITESKPKDKV